MLTKVIEQAKIDHFTKWFERADKIVIVSHVSPDGDAIGSSLGGRKRIVVRSGGGDGLGRRRPNVSG